MPIITGINKLEDILEQDAIDALEQAAEIHKNQSNISFSIKTLSEDKI